MTAPLDPRTLATARPLGRFAPGAFPRHWRKAARLGGLALAAASILGLLLISEPRTLLGRTLLATGFPGGALRLRSAGLARRRVSTRPGATARRSRSTDAGAARGAYNLGNALARSGDLKGALDAFDEALAYNPRDADAQANRSLIAKALEEEIDRGKGGGIANASAQYGARYGNTANQDQNDDIKATASGEGLAGNKEAGSSASLPGTSPVARRGKSEQQSVESARGRPAARRATPPGAGARARVRPWSPPLRRRKPVA